MDIGAEAIGAAGEFISKASSTKKVYSMKAKLRPRMGRYWKVNSRMGCSFKAKLHPRMGRYKRSRRMILSAYPYIPEEFNCIRQPNPGLSTE